MKHHRLDHAPFRIKPGAKVSLTDHDPRYTAGIKDKHEAKEALEEDKRALAEAQELLWATGEHAVLIIFQAMDAAGKDGAIKHVMSGINPQGCAVHNFRAPNEEERRHDFLWRPTRFLPQGGRIAIFNRSYYEEVLVVRVHPEFLAGQWLPAEVRDLPLRKLWKRRYEDITTWERNLVRNGTLVIKFFLNVSREEQRSRFIDRLSDPAKYFKFSPSDVAERKHWDAYREAYEDMLAATSTEEAPWYVIPADRKWFTRAAIADIIVSRVSELGLKIPQPDKATIAELQKVKRALEAEKA